MGSYVGRIRRIQKKSVGNYSTDCPKDGADRDARVFRPRSRSPDAVACVGKPGTMVSDPGRVPGDEFFRSRWARSQGRAPGPPRRRRRREDGGKGAFPCVGGGVGVGTGVLRNAG